MAAKEWTSTFAFPMVVYVQKRQFEHENASGAGDASETEDAAESDAKEGRETDAGSTSLGLLRPQEVRRQLAALNPPLHIPIQKHKNRTSSMKVRHIKVLVALMHRCVREGDFARAGRAFGMLIRTTYADRTVDLRLRGLYGVGAEILLRQRSQAGAEATVPQPAHVWSVLHRPGFSREGFEAAKAYYERLSQEYPYQDYRPHTVSSLDFYPIMYGLWIILIQDQLRQSLSTIAVDTSPQSMNQKDVNANPDAVKAREVAVAEISAVEESLVDLMIAPPFTDDGYLKQLRSSLGRWRQNLEPPTLRNDDSVADVEISGS